MKTRENMWLSSIHLMDSANQDKTECNTAVPEIKICQMGSRSDITVTP